MEKTWKKIDMHAHTEFSHDCESKVEAVLQRALARGLDGIAITDHGSVEGALLAKKIAREKKLPLIVIVGQEVKTPHGEVMGLFLKKSIPKCSIREAIAEIKRQGGVVSIPHPFDFARGSALNPALIPREELGKLDAMEVLNARVYAKEMNAQALAFAKKHSLVHLGGSDAHTLFEIGNAYTLVDAKDGAGVKGAILQGKTKVRGEVSSPLVHAFSRFASLKKKIIRSLAK
ncbi:PHP domain-containing protein [Candidatus Micrarchaeota archaeon]|nr:PHP domain-containing protein [Candidatus Micrarchaeota archaeon]